MTINLEHHPCFNEKSRHQFSRVHLPIAPRCNIQCGYCNRKFDCANENRPGVTSIILTPGQSLEYLDRIYDKLPQLAVVGIAGPGDPLANPEETLETLRLVREKYPHMLLCLATNGLRLPFYVDQLAALKISHVTITINAIDPAITENIYAWVRDEKKVYHGREAAELLLQRQLEGIRLLKAKNIIIKINSIIIPTINDHHIVEVAKKTAALGADIFNAMPLFPTPETAFSDIPEPSPDMINTIREQAKEYIPQMAHCQRCRADAAGILGQANNDEIIKAMLDCARLPNNPQEHRPYVAAASWEGMLVNQHLGRSEEFFIFNQNTDGYTLIERRSAPSAGEGDLRWEKLATLFKDCRAVLVNAAGNKPVEFLKRNGITVVEMDGLIEEGLDHVYKGTTLRGQRVQKGCACGSAAAKEDTAACGSSCGGSCSGTGMGCG